MENRCPHLSQMCEVLTSSVQHCFRNTLSFKVLHALLPWSERIIMQVHHCAVDKVYGTKQELLEVWSRVCRSST